MLIDERLTRCLKKLHAILQQYSEISAALAEAKAEFERKEAELIEEVRKEAARSDEKLTVRQVEARVLLQVSQEKAAYERLGAREKTLLEGLRTSRAELSALQTLAGLEREEASLARTSPEA